MDDERPASRWAEMTTARPGDLILVRSRGVVFRLGRRVAGNPYDHVAVVTSDGRTLNIDKPSARLLPLGRVLRAGLEPLVLRPRFASVGEQAAFVADLERLVSAPYDVERTLWLLERLVERRLTGRARRLPPLGPDRPRWICTDAVLLALERHVSGFSGLRDLPLDWVAIGSGTTNDLLAICRRRPDLMAVVAVQASGAASPSAKPSTS